MKHLQLFLHWLHSSREHRLLGFSETQGENPGEADPPPTTTETNEGAPKAPENNEGAPKSPETPLENGDVNEGAEAAANERVGATGTQMEKAQQALQSVQRTIDSFGSVAGQEALSNASLKKGIERAEDQLYTERDKVDQIRSDLQEALTALQKNPDDKGLKDRVRAIKKALDRQEKVAQEQFNTLLAEREKLRSLRPAPKSHREGHMRDYQDAMEDMKSATGLEKIAYLVAAMAALMASINGDEYPGMGNKEQLASRRKKRQEIKDAIAKLDGEKSAEALVTHLKEQRDKDKEKLEALENGEDVKEAQENFDDAKTAYEEAKEEYEDAEGDDKEDAKKEMKKAKEKMEEAKKKLEEEQKKIAEEKKRLQDVIAKADSQIAEAEAWASQVEGAAEKMTGGLGVLVEEFGDKVAFLEDLQIVPGKDGVSLAVAFGENRDRFDAAREAAGMTTEEMGLGEDGSIVDSKKFLSKLQVLITKTLSSSAKKTPEVGSEEGGEGEDTETDGEGDGESGPDDGDNESDPGDETEEPGEEDSDTSDDLGNLESGDELVFG